MLNNSHKSNRYNQIHGGVEKISEMQGDYFDIVFCHNVFEYIEDKEPIFAELIRMLKQGGTLSLVKHNRRGKVFQSAVFANDPKKALELLDEHANNKDNYLGTQYLYSNNDVEEWASKHGAKLQRILGMRTFWALGQDNSVKFSNEWYRNMLELERKASNMEEYRRVAFFNHLLLKKN